MSFWPQNAQITPQNRQIEQNLNRKFRFLARTMPKHFLDNSKPTLKNPENDFFDFQNGQKWPWKPQKWANFWPKKIEFWGHLSTFGAENPRKVDLLRKNLSEKNPTSSFKIGGIFEKKNYR